ncbi:unnamed protein product [Commensalibacter communis]|uniref:Uncharacterized protein n=1 Tax=Commensalibacter communis TaxID=2972786 RepID=A0A9W4XE77_9PROT|nr:hypothetical protein [Commensalibacter communis]CAI3941411.1 unnamed protein product [Commensalibacter communis]CAI3945215.1 unnamed protein product [Commensalibacter communis]CAI3959364.1 unnamed protein product [Commensalibacter communis]CAI3960733.1 unnamed protein product [Commensalibacter communis]
MSLNRPDPFLFKWAENGERFDVPNSGADHNNGRADVQTGFPKQTMVSVLQGGVPPWGRDHNGILYRLSEANQWTQAGGYPVFNQQLCDAIGGYSFGAIVATIEQNTWVHWISLENENKTDPNSLDITLPGVQKGWRRYPVITERNGASLYYNDAGELDIFTAENSIYKYVSWSTGSDVTGDGTRFNPFKTIDMAVQKAPSTGQIIIKVLDVDDHYIVGTSDKAAEDIHYYSPGNIYSVGDNIQEQPKETLAASINVGIRNIIIEPYNNPNGDPTQPDGWEELLQLTQRNVGDGWWGYCLTDEALASRGLRRPVLYKMWCYTYIYSENQWITIALRYCGFDGVQGNFSVGFLGCRLANYNLQDLDNASYFVSSAFERVGGTYMYNGCIIDNLCLHKENALWKYSMGGSDITTTNVSFRRQNSFIDYQQKREGLFVGVNSKITITVSDNREEHMPSTNYAYIDNSAIDFLSKASTFTETTLKIIPKPSSHYAYLDINLIIS